MEEDVILMETLLLVLASMDSMEDSVKIV